MTTVLLILFAVLTISALQRRPCPDCGAPVPGLIAPWDKTRRMWAAGNSRCAYCGCEVNAVGQKAVAAPTGWAAVQGLALALSLGVLLIVGAFAVLDRPAPAAEVKQANRG